MNLNSISILMDGSLWSGFVWVTIAVAGLATALLVVVVQILVWRIWVGTQGRRLALVLIAAVATVGTGVLGPSAMQATANLLAGDSSTKRVVVCFMPTNHPVRDTAPAGLVLVTTTFAGLLIGRNPRLSAS
jgi:hypothetical protein